MHIKNKIIQNLFSFFSFLKDNVLSTHTNTHTHTHKLQYANYTEIYTRHQKLIRGATYKTSNLKDRLIVVFVFRQKQQSRTHFLLCSRGIHKSNPKISDFYNFLWLNKFWMNCFANFTFVWFLLFWWQEIGKQNRNNTRWAPTKHTIRKYKRSLRKV